MKVALVHDYIKEYGGAERVLEALHELYPDADVYTSVYLPQFLGPHKERFKHWKIKTSWFQHVPFNHKLISPFRLFAAWTFGRFDLSGYDVVIVSATGAYFPNAIKTKASIASNAAHAGSARKGAIHICYCHTPPRYLYGYATAREWKKHKFFAFLASIANHFLRIVDFNVSQNVDFYVANSQEVAGRIKKFYRRDATVIYPPVEVTPVSFPRTRESSRMKSRKWIPDQVRNDNSGEYYLTGGRLARAKHVDLIVQACRDLNVPLKVFGRGFAGYEEELRKIVAPHPHPSPLPPGEREHAKFPSPFKGEGQGEGIEFLGEVSDTEKAELMAGAEAFLFASEDEDFGIVPVEAMAAGVPVIAHNSGGVRETIVNGKTGLLFDKLTVESLKDAIKRFEALRLPSGKITEDCRKQAEKFSKDRFMMEVKRFVQKYY